MAREQIVVLVAQLGLELESAEPRMIQMNYISDGILLP